MQVYAAAENASAVEAKLSYDWAPAADMALTVAPTSLFKATTCRFSCGPLCTREQKSLLLNQCENGTIVRKVKRVQAAFACRSKAEGPHAKC